ncbi:MAG: hypothetical protein O2890_07645 [Cyanobacteria bacterium]|nr:hypothetical protein [Cyanobacteriota bacterium]MDA0866280.1 hypothetical protein [Cyanobacteriota bacterium]
MDASLLRLLWSLIEETPTHLLMRLDSAGLCQYLLNKIDMRVCLDDEQHQALQAYIASHTHLIRESRELSSACVA